MGYGFMVLVEIQGARLEGAQAPQLLHFKAETVRRGEVSPRYDRAVAARQVLNFIQHLPPETFTISERCAGGDYKVTFKEVRDLAWGVD